MRAAYLAKGKNSLLDRLRPQRKGCARGELFNVSELVDQSIVELISVRKEETQRPVTFLTTEQAKQIRSELKGFGFFTDADIGEVLLEVKDVTGSRVDKSHYLGTVFGKYVVTVGIEITNGSVKEIECPECGAFFLQKPTNKMVCSNRCRKRKSDRGSAKNENRNRIQRENYGS
jgi:hypothetical protein